jgi:hypothetical protein
MVTVNGWPSSTSCVDGDTVTTVSAAAIPILHNASIKNRGKRDIRIPLVLIFIAYPS